MASRLLTALPGITAVAALCCAALLPEPARATPEAPALHSGAVLRDPSAAAREVEQRLDGARFAGHRTGRVTPGNATVRVALDGAAEPGALCPGAPAWVEPPGGLAITAAANERARPTPATALSGAETSGETAVRWFLCEGAGDPEVARRDARVLAERLANALGPTTRATPPRMATRAEPPRGAYRLAVIWLGFIVALALAAISLAGEAVTRRPTPPTTKLPGATVLAGFVIALAVATTLVDPELAQRLVLWGHLVPSMAMSLTAVAAVLWTALAAAHFAERSSTAAWIVPPALLAIAMVALWAAALAAARDGGTGGAFEDPEAAFDLAARLAGIGAVSLLVASALPGGVSARVREALSGAAPSPGDAALATATAALLLLTPSGAPGQGTLNEGMALFCALTFAELGRRGLSRYVAPRER
jgi:hypothetical protein